MTSDLDIFTTADTAGKSKKFGKRASKEQQRTRGLLYPRPDVFPAPAPTRRRSIRTKPPEPTGHRAKWVFMGAHGGAGVTLLTRMSSYPHDAAATRLHQGADLGEGPWWLAAETGTQWPLPPLAGTKLVVVVCNTTLNGIEWAKDVALQHLSGTGPEGITLLGLVSVADQPGRLPPALRNSLHLLDGLYAHHWQIPYIPQYRLITPTQTIDPPMHPAIETSLRQIRTIIQKGL